MGEIIGGFFWTWLLGGFVANKIWRDMEPTGKAFRAGLIGGLTCYTLSGFGFGNGTFNPVVGLFYLPGTLIGWWVLRRQYEKLWVDDSAPESAD